jgi:hypothetical protein
MTTAWQILQQEWKLSAPDARILTMLLTETPVALRGEEAMVPLSKLLPGSPRPLRAGHQLRTDSEKSELSGLLQKSWTVEFPEERFIGFPFVCSFMFVNDSQFMRYTLSSGLISTLKALKHLYSLDHLV